jgi:hypothetical protein
MGGYSSRLQSSTMNTFMATTILLLFGLIISRLTLSGMCICKFVCSQDDNF